jgi:hypothetical protein
MESIIDKLNLINDNDTEYIWKNWSLEEIKKLLEIYLIISKKETHIFDLIYDNHECDSWESIFRDYNTIYLENKVSGVEVAIENIIEKIKNE